LTTVEKGGLAQASDLLLEGKLVIVPTNTVYALMCDAEDEAAVTLMRKIRGRDGEKPFSVALRKEDIGKYSKLTERQQKIIDVALPAEFTIFVDRVENALGLCAQSSPLLCIMCQDGPIGEVTGRTKRPLAVTSVNPAGMQPAYSIELCREYFGDQIDIYVDGGVATVRSASAQVDIRQQPVTQLRDGPWRGLEKLRAQLAERGIE
jgi:L-threonylcarbamoyladenylate synthase